MSKSTRLKLGWERPAMLERIVYTDDRERVLETDEYPWCLIAFLEIEFPLGSGIGTGWLVGGNKILTAGHCLYSHDHGGWAQSIKVIPGNDVDKPEKSTSDDAPYGSYEAVALQTTPEWISDAKVELDVGMIHIDYPIGDDLGNFGISVYSESNELNGAMIRIAGYPMTYHPLNEETNSLSEEKVAGQMYTHSDKIIDIKDGRILYELDTTGGQSGSPVVLLGLDVLGPVAIGIHNYGYGNFQKQENKATLINQNIWDHIQHWLSEDY